MHRGVTHVSETKKKNIKKRKKGIETTNKILEASADLFAHKGYDSVPMVKIAQVVGVKESSLYNHFKSKAAILETLFDIFKKRAPEFRPSESELNKILMFMQPEEIFKNILFYFGRHEDSIVENIAMVINNEKYRNAEAANVYYRCVVKEPSDYYERLIEKMSKRGIIRQVDARIFAEQYNYVSISLTKEYFMAKNGLADMQTVVKYMIKTINFFCNMMKGNAGDPGYEDKT